MNDIPDELLDNIALFVDQPSLKSLALVERRFYEPARRQTRWETQGLKGLLEFLDVILENPRLAFLVRWLTLGDDSSLEVPDADLFEFALRIVQPRSSSRSVDIYSI